MNPLQLLICVIVCGKSPLGKERREAVFEGRHAVSKIRKAVRMKIAIENSKICNIPAVCACVYVCVCVIHCRSRLLVTQVAFTLRSELRAHRPIFG